MFHDLNLHESRAIGSVSHNLLLFMMHAGAAQILADLQWL